MSHVTEINDPSELDAYHLLWRSLLLETRNASFFQSLEWLEAYWRHYGPGQKLRVLIAQGADRPIGILPLCVRTEQYKLGPLRVLTYPLHDWGTYYGPIGPNPTATLLAAMRHLRETPRDWDLVDLRWVDTAHLDHGRTRRAMQHVGLAPLCQRWAETAMVDLSGTWEEYFASRSSKWRNNYRRNERRLAQRGNVTLLRYRPAGQASGEGGPRWDLYEACEQIAERSWQGASQSGTTLSHDVVRPFLRDAHLAAAQSGMLDLNLLRVADRFAAFAYNYHFDGRVQGLRAGFDPDFRHEGCGNVLLVRTIEDSFRRGDTLLDLGVGSLATKRHLATHFETCDRCTYFPPTVARAQALRAKHLLRRWWNRQQRPAKARGA